MTHDNPSKHLRDDQVRWDVFLDTVSEEFTTRQFESTDEEVEFLHEALEALRVSINTNTDDDLNAFGERHLHLGQS